MKIVYSDQEIPSDLRGTALFLAGPTPRSENVSSWRPEALKLLESNGFSGIVFVPELGSGKLKQDYTDQVSWELECLEHSDRIVFWIPRCLKDMPGFTTNVEFGFWLSSGKVLYGRPETTPKTKYLDLLYKRHESHPIFSSLEELIEYTCKQPSLY
jgi:hypothetical protein